MWTLLCGFLFILFSLFVPAVIAPFAHGVPMGEPGEGIMGGMRQQQFMRAFYGGVVCLVIAVVVTYLTRPESPENQKGLVWGTISHALKHYMGSFGKESVVTKAKAMPKMTKAALPHFGTTELPGVRISRQVARDLESKPGDLVYVTDARSWTGGLHSVHAIVAEVVDDGDERMVEMEEPVYKLVVTRRRHDHEVKLERLYESTEEPEKRVSLK
jgi:hypothetical protein